jgi:hypothetical protein
MNVTFDFDSPEDFTTYVHETAGPWGLSNQTQQRKGDIESGYRSSKKICRQQHCEAQNEAICIVGKK